MRKMTRLLLAALWPPVLVATLVREWLVDLLWSLLTLEAAL